MLGGVQMAEVRGTNAETTGRNLMVFSKSVRRRSAMTYPMYPDVSCTLQLCQQAMAVEHGHRKFVAFPIKDDGSSIPRCSMYGIFTNIGPKNHPNVGKYTIHGAYGYGLPTRKSNQNLL